jgi:hypothetical protein
MGWARPVGGGANRSVTPSRHTRHMPVAASANTTFGAQEFALAARSLAHTAQGLGLIAPSYRTPPRVAGADRTLRRGAKGAVMVAVRVRRRPVAAVLADMIEGVVAANSLAGRDAERCRAVLWDAVQPIGEPLAA